MMLDNSTPPSTPLQGAPALPAPLPNNQEELFEGFHGVLNIPKISCSEIRDLCRAPERLTGGFTIYPLHYLPSHADIPMPEDILWSLTPPEDPLPHEAALPLLKPLRFVVNTQDELWFAFNGRAQWGIPYHTEISSHCYSAGEVLINTDNKICQIDNKSGHFKPCWTRLVYLLHHLLKAPELLSDTLTITAWLGENNQASFDVSVAELLFHFQSPAPESQTRFRNRPRELFRERYVPSLLDMFYYVSRDLASVLEDAERAEGLNSNTLELALRLPSSDSDDSSPLLGCLLPTQLTAPPAKRVYTPLRSSQRYVTMSALTTESYTTHGIRSFGSNTSLR